MASTAIFTDGPSGEAFQDVFGHGIKQPIFFGTAAFVSTETTVTVPGRGGGLINTCFYFGLLQGVNEVLRGVVNADGSVTFTRTDTTTGGKFIFMIVYN